MGAKITVMSGSRQGQTFTVTKNCLSVGQQPHSDVEFDLTADPDCEGQQISILLQDDKWYLHNASRRALYLNHDVVKESTGLRSGDLIRLSLDGPDLLFEIISINEVDPQTSGVDQSQTRLVLNANSSQVEVNDSQHSEDTRKSSSKLVQNDVRVVPKTSGTLQSNQESENVVAKHDLRNRVGRTTSSSQRRPRRTSKMAIMVGVLSVLSGALAGVSIAIVLLWVVWKKDPLGVISSGPPAKSLSLPIDSSLEDHEEDSGSVTEAADSKVGQVPATGGQPTESEMSTQLSPDGKSESAQQTTAKVDGMLRFRPVERQQVDLSKDSFLSLDISEYLISKDDGANSYRISEESPKGMEIDSVSGLLTWDIPRSYGGSEVAVNLSVSSSAPNSRPTAVSFDVVLFFSDPWDLIEQQLLSSVYLLAAKVNPGDRYLVLGTACAISDRQLLSSATVVSGMIRAEQRGWSVLAISLPNGIESNPREVSLNSRRLHRMYLDALKKTDEITRRTQQAFFDLSLIETNESLDSHVTLAQMKGGETDAMGVACLGFSVNGNLTSDLSDLRPEFTTLDLLGTFTPTNASLDEGRPPLLLEIEGTLPVHNYGGLIVNSMADVVGVYGFEGDSDAMPVATPVHYAAEVLLPKLFLEGRGTDLWVSDTEVDIFRVVAGEQ